MVRQTCLLIILLVALAACGADKQPEVLFFPTITPTINSSATATLTPTITLSPTATIPPPTATTRPTLDPQGAPPTNPVRPTFTLAPSTQTATFLPTNIGLNVEYFITNIERISPGETVTLFWRVNGVDAARIYRLDEEGNRTRFWDVNAEGRLTVGTEAEEAALTVRFLIQAELGESVIEQELAIPSTCPFSWFFQPAPLGCPNDVPLPTFQVEQRFEGGLMLWLSAEQNIYVLFTDGDTPTWQQFTDNFVDGMPERDDSLVPPGDRYQPVRGFGLVWRENEQVRERLGWAVEQEVGYDGIIQTSTETTGEATIYLRTRDGGIIRLLAESWEILELSNVPPPVPPELLTQTPAPSG